MFAPGIPHGPPRIGYCCLYRSPAADAKDEARFNVTGTTVTALQRMERAAVEKVLALVARNRQAMEAHLRRVATASPIERMLRLDGNVLPAFTHPVARWMYDEPAMRELVEAGLGACGRIAREGGVRLGLHPGPYLAALVADGHSVRDLRAHSDTMWNEAVNDWVVRHLVWTDIEVEAKLKNVASLQLAERARTQVQAGTSVFRRLDQRKP